MGHLLVEAKQTLYHLTTMSAPRTDQIPWLRLLIIIVAVVLLAPIFMMAIMMPMMGMMGGWAGGVPNSGTGISPMWGLGMMLFCLVILLGIGYFIYQAFTSESLTPDDRPLEELRLAYARGELSQEEFEQREEDLRQSN